MKNTVIATEAVPSREMVCPGNGIHSIRTPRATTMPAASTWPANLVSAGRSNRSSSTPTRQITPAAINTARESCCTTNWRPRNGSCQARTIAPTTPANIATPPKYGIAMVCTSRSRTSASAFVRNASRRHSPLARKVMAAATSITRRYSRTQPPTLP